MSNSGSLAVDPLILTTLPYFFIKVINSLEISLIILLYYLSIRISIIEKFLCFQKIKVNIYKK